MEKIGMLIFILFFLIGCSNESETMEYKAKIEEQQKEIQHLTKELQEFKSDYSMNLQIFDGTSRKIMRLIADGKFEELKNNYKVDFEVKDSNIHFATPENGENSPFPIEQAKFPMFIAFFNKQPESTEIGYYIDDLANEERHLIAMVFDKDSNFKYIFVGDT